MAQPLRFPVRRFSWLAVLLALLVCAGAALSGLVSRSDYAPLAAAAAAAALGLAVLFVRRPVWGVYFALVVIFLPLGLLPLTWHSLLNRAVTVGAVGAWLANSAFTRRKLSLPPPALWMLAFILWSALSLAWTVDMPESQENLQVYILRCALFLLALVNLVKEPGSLRGLMRVLALNGWILMVAFAGTVLTQGYTFGDRLKILSMNENEAAVNALVFMLGILWLADQQPGRAAWRRALAGVPYLALCMALIAMSGSRGALISLAVTLAVLFLFRNTRHWAWLGGGLALAGALALPQVLTTLVTRFLQPEGGLLLNGREVLWPAAWRVILDHFWTGVGIGAGPAEIETQVRGMVGVLLGYTSPAHNPVLAIWADTGLIGLLLFLSVPASVLWIFLRAWRAGKTGSGVPLAAAVAAGYAFSWIKGGGVESELTYFLLLGLLLVIAQVDDALDGGEGSQP